MQSAFSIDEEILGKAYEYTSQRFPSHLWSRTLRTSNKTSCSRFAENANTRENRICMAWKLCHVMYHMALCVEQSQVPQNFKSLQRTVSYLRLIDAALSHVELDPVLPDL